MNRRPDRFGKWFGEGGIQRAENRHDVTQHRRPARGPGSRIPHPRHPLRVLDIGVTIDGDMNVIPPRGAVVVIANHPGGAVDGLALLEAAQRQRSDVKLNAL